MGPIAVSTAQAFLDGDGRPLLRSPEIIACAEREAQALVRAADERADALLSEHGGQLDALADILLERETIEGPELRRMLGQPQAPSAVASAETV